MGQQEVDQAWQTANKGNNTSPSSGKKGNFASSALMPNYARLPVAFVRGQGTRLWDDSGREYLDFISGIGVNNLGHCPPAVVAAVQEQVTQLIHTSNLYRVPLQEQLAQRLVDTCFADRVFFCNSGAEANEAAIKLVRRYTQERDKGHKRAQSGRYEIITTINSFHGRTMATLTATGQDKVQRGYEPLLPGFRYVPFNNIEAVAKAITPQTAAIMVEPIQGESGVVIPADDYLPALRALADQHGLLLVLDEVQTGLGRTGRLWCHQWSSITPDIMTIAKSLASGLPMGACLAREEVARVFSPGSHGSTFGGTPLVSAAALATLHMLLDQGVIASVNEKGAYLLSRLQQLQQRHEMIRSVRGRGLMLAVELNSPAEEILSVCLSRGLLLSCQMGTILRFLPPLTLSQEEMDQAVAILDGVLTDSF
ncbi:aspartate aminotransferase family protein [Candidatus Magnetaquicoccus inordinatus]|uniref:aspartate aminotransferase family protein n=1 Tax=Candidatus Magnetaquicoccus inordinatus TaxID=2496818 RepID=UPI00102BE8F0|nr:aspartate aminotransferase family protein [Candidatus Magnetaquicoccus inordinatus]